MIQLEQDRENSRMRYGHSKYEGWTTNRLDLTQLKQGFEIYHRGIVKNPDLTIASSEKKFPATIGEQRLVCLYVLTVR